MKIPPFFLIGAQRSGTTLLRLILNAHSDIAIPEEGTFLMPLLKKKYLHREFSGTALKNLTRYLSLNPQLKLWGCDYGSYLSQLETREHIALGQLIDDIFSIFCQQQGKNLWGDKTPPFFRKIDIFSALYPQAKFIHIVRDGRDVFDSWRKIDPAKNNVSTIALDWSYKLSKIQKSLSRIPLENQLTIRYEDLLEHPESSVRSVCTLLDVEYQPNMLEFYQTSHRYIGTHHSQLIFKPLDKTNKFKWKKNLTRREANSFTLLARGHLEKYDYETQMVGMNLTDLLLTVKNLVLGIPKRGLEVLRVKNSYDSALREGTSGGVDHVGDLPEGIKTAGSSTKETKAI